MKDYKGPKFMPIKSKALEIPVSAVPQSPRHCIRSCHAGSQVSPLFPYSFFFLYAACAPWRQSITSDRGQSPESRVLPPLGGTSKQGSHHPGQKWNFSATTTFSVPTEDAGRTEFD